MTLTLIEFALIATFAQYLLGEAKITRRIFGWARRFYVVRCVPCAGAWIGAALTPVGPWSQQGAAGWLKSAAAGSVLVAVLRSLMDLTATAMDADGKEH